MVCTDGIWLDIVSLLWPDSLLRYRTIRPMLLLGSTRVHPSTHMSGLLRDELIRKKRVTQTDSILLQSSRSTSEISRQGRHSHPR